MNPVRMLRLLPFVLLGACDAPSSPPPQSAESPKPAGPQEFFDGYRAALKTQDPAKVLPLIGGKFREQFEADLKKDEKGAREKLALMAKFQEEALAGCTAAAPVEVDGETRILYTKPHITVTVRLAKEGTDWKLLKLGVDDKTPPAAPK